MLPVRPDQESVPLLDNKNGTKTTTAAADPTIAVAISGASSHQQNVTSAAIARTNSDGPVTFRMLGFIGGLAMVVSNGLTLQDRLFAFEYSGFITGFYGILFGLIICVLEGPCSCVKWFSTNVRFYAKFLEYAWGRGAFYIFCGTIQVAHWNVLDWVVGGFMIVVGLIAISVGISTARNLRLVRYVLKDEAMLKQKWIEHDADKNGRLDIRELTSFIRDAGVDMTRNEVAAAFLALDKNFDDKITYDELFEWWIASGDLRLNRALSV